MLAQTAKPDGRPFAGICGRSARDRRDPLQPPADVVPGSGPPKQPLPSTATAHWRAKGSATSLPISAQIDARKAGLAVAKTPWLSPIGHPCGRSLLVRCSSFAGLLNLAGRLFLVRLDHRTRASYSLVIRAACRA